MLSTFQLLPEQEKKLFVAKILNEINYNQASYNLMKLLVNYWDENPVNDVQYFPHNLNTTKTLNYEHRTN